MLSLVVVTGFLGAGKTTLVRRLLRTPAGADAAVVVNEFGEVGVDHRLLEHVPDRIELIENGLQRRADISSALHRLIRRAGGVAGLPRVILETSGLADPAPIVATVVEDPWLAAHVRLDRIVAVVDAVCAVGNLAGIEAARRQVAMADTVVVTKGDLRAARPLAEVIGAVRAVAPDVAVLDGQDPETAVEGLLRAGPAPRRLAVADPPAAAAGSFVLDIDDRAVDWPAFTVWLSALLHAHGDRILRVKGVLRTSSSPHPLAVHGVQRTMHPPVHLSGTAERSFLVFITRGLDAAAVRASLDRFLALGAAVPPEPGYSRCSTLSTSMPATQVSLNAAFRAAGS